MTRQPPLTNEDAALRRAWHPVARSGDVGSVPLTAGLLGEEWVLVRLDGEVAAFPDRCPHRLAPLSAGWIDDVDGRSVLRCGYHGWCFTAQGGCVEIPALGAGDHLPPRARLEAPFGVTERYGLVWLAVEAPIVPIPDLCDLDDARLARSQISVIDSAVGAGLMMDNFLDTAHFPFVHPATIGLPDDPGVEEPVIERHDLGLAVRYEHDFDNHPDPGVAAGARPLRQRRRLEYRYQAPFAMTLRIDELDAGRTNVIVLVVRPVGAEGCVLYTVVLRSGHASEAEMADALAYELTILGEDLALQERFPDLVLPLDLTTEVHTRADRVTVELRRILADLVRRACSGVDGSAAVGVGRSA
jgi:phenylpropionate dioxygenase-like ring-hydroxylating dioxygenase large terminal subunit